MKQLLLVGFLLICNIGISQSPKETISKLKRANPGDFSDRVKELRMNGQYDSIISLIEEDSIIESFYYHQLACYNAKKKNYAESYKYIYKALKEGVFINDVLTDTDLELLYNQPEWKNVEDTIQLLYLKNNPNIKNEELSLRLWKIGIEDQRYRTLGSNNKRYNLIKGSTMDDSISELHTNKIKENLDFIKKLVKEKNWPLYSEVGKESGDAAFLVVQHSADKKLLKNTLKILEIEVTKNEASNESYAMMLDRALVHKNRKQIYGTQILSYSVGVDSTGNWIMGNNFIAPIKNEIEINQRRKAIGLGLIEEYATKFGINYQYHSEYIKLRYKSQLKRLIENSKE